MEKNKISLEARIRDIQINLNHLRTKSDQMVFYLQKIEKLLKEEGIKVKK